MVVFYLYSFQVIQNTWKVCNLYFMNYYLKESSKIFLLKYLKYTKITIFIIISPKLGKESTSRPKKSTKKHCVRALLVPVKLLCSLPDPATLAAPTDPEASLHWSRCPQLNDKIQFVRQRNLSKPFELQGVTWLGESASFSGSQGMGAISFSWARILLWTRQISHRQDTHWISNHLLSVVFCFLQSLFLFFLFSAFLLLPFLQLFHFLSLVSPGLQVFFPHWKVLKFTLQFFDILNFWSFVFGLFLFVACVCTGVVFAPPFLFFQIPGFAVIFALSFLCCLDHLQVSGHGKQRITRRVDTGGTGSATVGSTKALFWRTVVGFVFKILLSWSSVHHWADQQSTVLTFIVQG